MAIAVCVQVKVKANSKENIDFSLVWNMPTFSFNGDKDKVNKRFYTKYFSDENENCALDISNYAQSQRAEWIRLIREWQKPILTNE